MPNPGDKIFLSLQLGDGATDKYVTGECRDAARNVLFGGPVTLPHESGGQYVEYTKIMPDTLLVSCQYKVWNDAGHTIPSPEHEDSQDIFEKSLANDEILEMLRRLLAAGISAPLTGYIRAPANLKGQITEGALIGRVHIDKLEGTAVSSTELTGTIETPEIKGEIE